MIMDALEIANSYKYAKNPVDQIKVLSELNVCDVYDILKIIKDIVPVTDDTKVYRCAGVKYKGIRNYSLAFVKHKLENASERFEPIKCSLDRKEDAGEKAYQEFFSKNISKKLMQIVDEMGIARNDFADMCGLSASNLYTLINGNNKNPSVCVITKICNVTKIPLSYFLEDKRIEECEKFEPYPETKEEIGKIVSNKIKNAICKNGMNSVLEYSGISQAGLYKFVRKENTPKVTNYIHLCKGCNETIDSMLR